MGKVLAGRGWLQDRAQAGSSWMWDGIGRVRRASGREERVGGGDEQKERQEDTRSELELVGGVWRAKMVSGGCREQAGSGHGIGEGTLGQQGDLEGGGAYRRGLGHLLQSRGEWAVEGGHWEARGDRKGLRQRGTGMLGACKGNGRTGTGPGGPAH